MTKDNINGISYNTKTAETIARNGSGKTVNHSDERWFSQTLYRKKSGEFFLCSSCGIFTKYAKQTGPNSWERSEAILPLTQDEVREWAINNLDDNGYRNICQKIEEKPVPVVKEKRQYTRRASVIDPEKIETVINIIKNNSSISQLDLAQKAGFSKSSIVVIMDSLKESGRLTRVSSRRKGQWVIDGVQKEAEQQIAEAKKPVKTKKKKPTEKKIAVDRLNYRVDKILDALRKQPDITQRALAKDTGISLLKVNAILQQLRTDGTIIREGTSKRGSWIIKGEESKPSGITVYGTHHYP